MVAYRDALGYEGAGSGRVQGHGHGAAQYHGGAYDHAKSLQGWGEAQEQQEEDPDLIPAEIRDSRPEEGVGLLRQGVEDRFLEQQDVLEEEKGAEPPSRRQEHEEAQDDAPTERGVLDRKVQLGIKWVH